MGLNTAHKLTHQLKKVTQEELLKILRARASRRPPGDKPTIDVDVSYLYRKFPFKDPKRRVSSIIRMCDMLCQLGLRVVLVCDGNKRHHSKRACYVRSAEKYKKKIQLYNIRCEIMQINTEKNQTSTLDEKQQLKEKEEKLSEQCTKLEKYVYNSDVDVGDTLFLHLIEECNKLKEKHPNIDLIVLQAEFQADSVLAYRMMQTHSDIVISSDSDLAALCGSKCISISKHAVKEEKNRNTQLTDLELFFADEKTLYEIGAIIGVQRGNERITVSQCPVFDGIENHYIRALVAVGVGCDVHSGGIPGLSPATIYQQLKYLKQQYASDDIKVRDGIMKFFVDEYKVQENDNRSKYDISKMIRIFTDAFMFEPGNFRTDTMTDVKENTRFIHGNSPTYLHKYIQEFTRNDPDIPIADIDDDNCISVCQGPGTGTHPFLTLEGCKHCAACYAVCCRHCTFSHKIHQDMNEDGCDVDEYVEVDFCVNCYLSELSVSKQRMENNLSKEEMIRELSSIASFQLQQSDNLADVMDIYDCLIMHPENILYDKSIVDKIKFPCENAKFINQQNVIVPFDFKDGAQFIADDRLNMDQRIHILELMAHLITYPENNGRACEEYKVIPTILVDFAEGSRLHTGFRLLKRTIRHAMDPTGPPLLKANGYITNYNGQIAMTIVHNIKASMKSDTYSVQVCFTKDKLVGCTCSCKAGAFGNERIVCVHVLPVIYSVTQLMFDGLAAHFLSEFGSIFTKEIEKNWKKMT